MAKLFFLIKKSAKEKGRKDKGELKKTLQGSGTCVSDRSCVENHELSTNVIILGEEHLYSRVPTDRIFLL